MSLMGILSSASTAAPQFAVEVPAVEQLEILLKEYSGLLSRMKERDGNENLNQICLDEYAKSLHE